MNNLDLIYFFEISGVIPGNKTKEFEQTIRFVFNQLPDSCLERNLMKDLLVENRFSILSIWKNESVLQKFLKSEECNLIHGAYEALGSLNHSFYGPCKKSNSAISY